MTVYVITLKHEYQGSNGSYYDEYVDPEQGYYPTAEARDLRLSELRAKERESWDESQHRKHEEWDGRRIARKQALAQQDLLKAAGGDPRLINVPWTSEEPVAVEWQTDWSEYGADELEMGVS